MAKPTILYPDGMKAAIVAVRSVLSGRSEPYASGVTVSAKVPRPGTPPTPFVLIRLDGTAGTSPLAERATIRASVWHDSEEDGLALANLLRALLLAYPGDGSLHGFSRLTGPIPTEDPESGRPLTYFTVAARLRPETL
jgi:hypothetical protein